MHLTHITLCKNDLVPKKRNYKRNGKVLLEPVHLSGIPDVEWDSRVQRERERVQGWDLWQFWDAVVLGGRGLLIELGMDANVALNVDLSFLVSVLMENGLEQLNLKIPK